MGFEYEDLEFNGTSFKKQYKTIIKVYRDNQKYLSKTIKLLVAVTFVIIVRWGLTNVDVVVQRASGVVFDEPNYVPFSIGQLDMKNGHSGIREQFVIRTSVVNHRMQIFNLVAATNAVHEYLLESGNICVHLGYFGVRYDIIVFHNVTVVNPRILSEGPVRVNLQEVTVDGERKWASRATTVEVAYYDENLVHMTSTLTGPQAFCLLHYGSTL
jgi:hypothetical protein